MKFLLEVSTNLSRNEDKKFKKLIINNMIAELDNVIDVREVIKN